MTVTYGYEAIARICHEANRQLQIINEDPVNPSWEALDNETKESAIDGVQNVIEENATPRESHENWLKFKEKHGWTYGPIKDEEKKKHPCFVPYDDLPPDQQIKDALFTAIVEVFR